MTKTTTRPDDNRSTIPQRDDASAAGPLSAIVLGVGSLLTGAIRGLRRIRNHVDVGSRLGGLHASTVDREWTSKAARPHPEIVGDRGRDQRTAPL